MAEIIDFRAVTEPWERSPPLAVNGYWVTCETCRADCFRAGHFFVACAEHTMYRNVDKSRRGT